MQEIKRITKFGIVGIINTAIDFAFLNVLHFRFGLGLLVANLISTSIAVCFSFFANRHIVFKHHRKKIAHQMALFWVITGFGLYVLQSGVIWLGAHSLHGLVYDGVHLAHHVGFHHFTEAFIAANIIKVVADVITMVWNYIGYREWVFTDKTKGQVQ